MAFFDLPLPELDRYRPRLPECGDFDEFWSNTLIESREFGLAATFSPVANHLVTVETQDVTFSGYGGTPIRAWLHLPAARQGRLPAIVEYIGYGGGRGLPHERTLWASAGYAHFVMDTRGQGSTDDPDVAAGDVAWAGYVTSGALDPERYYYRRVFTDAVLAIDAVRSHPDVDGSRIAVTGTSQGGGIALAAAGLATGLVAAMVDVPFLCDFPRATVITDANPYVEVRNFLKSHREHAATVNRTLSYFDGASHARRATVPALFSVALMDQTCPPSTVFAAFNHYAAQDKEIRVYPYNSHEGGGPVHEQVKLTWLRDKMPAPIGQPKPAETLAVQ